MDYWAGSWRLFTAAVRAAATGESLDALFFGVDGSHLLGQIEGQPVPSTQDQKVECNPESLNK